MSSAALALDEQPQRPIPQAVKEAEESERRFAAFRHFFRVLAPEAETVRIQTFDDSGKRPELAKQFDIDPEKPEHFKKLDRLNKQNAGIFWAVNVIEKGKPRRNENVTEARVGFADFDGPPLPDKWEIEPHLIVQTSPGKFHSYWIVDGLPLDQFPRVQKAIAEKLGSDPAVCDLSRVARVPGFRHCKNPDPSKQPLVETIHSDEHQQPYALAQITEAFMPKATPQAAPGAASGAADAIQALGQRNAPQDDRFDPLEAIRAIQAAENYHEPLIRLAARYVSQKLPEGEIVELLRGLMRGVDGPKDARWQSRYNEIPRSVKTAVQKYAKPSATLSGFRLSPVSELLKEPEPLVWLLKDYLPPEGLAFLIGPPAAGKSLLAIDWACCIATGTDWHGHDTQQGGVIILAGEGHHGIRRRIKAWALQNGINLTDAPLAVSDRSAALTDPNSLAEVTAAIDAFSEQHGSPRLILIDTLHRNLGAADENSAQDMAVYFNHLDEMRGRYRCQIVTVHHSGHADAGRGRGSSAIRAGVDAEFLVTPKSGGVLSLSCAKMKDAPKPALSAYEIIEVQLPWMDADGFAEQSVTIRPTEAPALEKTKRMPGAIRYALETLSDAIHQHGNAGAVHLDDWRGVFYAGHTGDTANTKKTAFLRARNELAKHGVLSVRDDWYRIETAERVPWHDCQGFIETLEGDRQSDEFPPSGSPAHGTSSAHQRNNVPGNKDRTRHIPAHTPKGVCRVPTVPSADSQNEGWEEV